MSISCARGRISPATRGKRTTKLAPWRGGPSSSTPNSPRDTRHWVGPITRRRLQDGASFRKTTSTGRRRWRKKAAGLDPTLTSAYVLLANLFLYRGEYERALAQADRAIVINPNDAANFWVRGSILIYAGRSSEAISWLEASLHLDSANFAASGALGVAKYFLAQYGDAIEAFDQALARDPGRVNQLIAHPLLAACYARLGRMQEAGRERAIVARLSPFFDAERFAAQFGTQQARDDMLVGLKAAGFL